MKCALDYDKILAYCLGELSGIEAEEVKRHIASCPRCQRELKAADDISMGFTELPRMAPDAARWVELRGAIEREQRPGVIRLLSALAHSFRKPVVAGAALLLTFAVGGYLFMRREPVTAHREIAVEEMGSTIAHMHPGNRGFGEALDSYLDDSRALVAGASRCAASEDAGCWRDLSTKIVESDMLYRGIWLSERLSRPSGASLTENAKARSLIEDSLGVFRAINEQSPERLIDTGSALGKEITRMDLLNRLTEGRGR
jgi:hypothetical protein